MDIEITKEKENTLLDRKEITFIIPHPGPAHSRNEVKKKLAAQLNSEDELVIVDKSRIERIKKLKEFFLF